MTLASVSICPGTLQTQAGVRFLSVCSGIEAASVAWAPLGWRALAFSEIEPFPSAVLAHHYPSVPNLGDMTTLPEKIRDGVIDAPEILCGGTPCQAFSVAGLRRSLEDDRGNLSLTFCEIANAIDAVRAIRGAPPSVVFWENVPGVLSTKDNAFGCFLAGLAGEDLPLEPPGGKWTDAGCVHGPARTVAWRTLDAQYFGVAQRRKRVFVVASARDQFDPAQVLFEWEGVRRDSAPSRQAGQRIAPTIAGCANGGGANGPGRDVDSTESLQVMSSGQANAEIRTDGGAPTLTCLHEAPIVAHSLRGEGFDASEDGTGRGTPLVPVHAFDARQSDVIQYGDKTGPLDTDGHTVGVMQPVAFDTTQITSAANYSNPKPGDPCHPLAAGAHAPAIAFSSKDHGADATADLAPTLRAMNHADSHANGGGQMAVVFPIISDADRASSSALTPSPDAEGRIRLRDPGLGIGDNGDPMFTLQATKTHAVATTMQVRRLTPRECERLQGFPTVLETVKIQACIDHQNSVVRAAIQCRRLQNNAWSAGESESQSNVKTAAASLITHQADREPLAALHVRMHSVDEFLEVRSLGRLIWSANGVGASSKSLPPTLTGNTAQELARLLREAAHSARSGKVASPQNISLSFPASSGATSAEKSGQEMAASASGVTSGQKQATFTTSDLGRITTSCDSTAATLCCFALHAIAGCIPSTTLPETFSIELTVETPYTAIPWRNKPASECPDGPRYKALGNSWAVPVVRWIGERIHRELRGELRPET